MIFDVEPAANHRAWQQCIAAAFIRVHHVLGRIVISIMPLVPLGSSKVSTEIPNSRRPTKGADLHVPLIKTTGSSMALKIVGTTISAPAFPSATRVATSGSLPTLSSVRWLLHHGCIRALTLKVEDLFCKSRGLRGLGLGRVGPGV